MATTRTFNKKIIHICKRGYSLLAYYDSFNMHSHDVDSDSNGGFDFNTTLNLNMFRFIVFPKDRYGKNNLFVEKDSVY